MHIKLYIHKIQIKEHPEEEDLNEKNYKFKTKRKKIQKY